ncbi:MAG: hypothetical protein IJ361_05150 [Spirochaetaceae bacterium]|nr:hypothetical protein [Spirochaetaceae bacterium]
MNIPIEKLERQKLAQNLLKNAGLLCGEVPELLENWILYTSPYNSNELYFLPMLEKLKENPDFVPNQKVEFFVNISEDLPLITEFSLPIWWGGFWEYSVCQKWISGIAVTNENIIIFSEESSCPFYIRETLSPCGAGGAYDPVPTEGKISVFNRKDFSKIKTQGMSVVKTDKTITDYMFKMINKNNPSSANIFESLKFNIKQRLILMRYGLGVRKSLYRKPINYKNQEELNRAFQNYINKNGILLTEEEKQTGILIEMRPPREFDKPFCGSSFPTFQKVLKEDSEVELLKIENLGVVERCEWEKVKAI